MLLFLVLWIFVDVVCSGVSCLLWFGSMLVVGLFAI